MATLSSLSPSLHSHPRTFPSPSPSSSPSFLSPLKSPSPRSPTPFSNPRATANGAVRGGAALAAAAEFVPVTPSDVLTIFFKAEGTMMDESNIPAVTKLLEVQVAEGVASVELTKQTTVQATAVASNLVEILQGSGFFKLQALNLSFEDEEDVAD